MGTPNISAPFKEGGKPALKLEIRCFCAAGVEPEGAGHEAGLEKRRGERMERGRRPVNFFEQHAALGPFLGRVLSRFVGRLEAGRTRASDQHPSNSAHGPGSRRLSIREPR